MNELVQSHETRRIYELTQPILNQLNGKTLLISGATGLIGSQITHLIQFHNSQSGTIKLKVLVRNPAKFSKMFPKFDGQIFDSKDFLSDTNLQQFQADYAIDLAAPTDSQFMATHPVETINVILDSAQFFLRLQRERLLERLVLTSSNEVYGNTFTDDLLTEADLGDLDLSDPRSSYPQAKRTIETLAKAHASEFGLEVAGARLGICTGFGVSADDQRSYVQFAKTSLAGEPIKLLTDGSTHISLISPADAIHGILTILLKGQKGEVYNVTNPNNYTSIFEVANLIQTTMNPPGSVLINQFGDTSKFLKVRKLNMSIAKLQALGWEPYDNLAKILDGLQESLR